MANVRNRKGLELATPLMSSHWYPKSTAAALFPGDAVVMAATGKVGRAAAGGVEILGANLAYAAATATDVLVADDPDQQYYINDDGAGGTLAATDVGLNFDIVVAAGNTTTLKSNMELDTNTGATTNGQLRLLDKHPDDDWADYVRCRVVINEHHYAKKIAGL